MHITPDPPSMTVARVREIVEELGATKDQDLVAYFNRGQLVDLLADIDLRAPSGPSAPVKEITDLPAITAYRRHISSCDRCHNGSSRGDRCDAGHQLYGAACAALVDQTRLLL